ncbi:hypothetical protein K523DRAFT_412296 [Schizophyllum commune Tattone D]|nr:hypothetical protein K523DRAFT_412296 [Schizophyllum commune Tattone D]
MQSNKVGDAPSRSEEYYVEGGDIVVQVENTLFRLHGFHLKRATTFFEDFFKATVWDAQSRLGQDDSSPLIIDKLKAKDFEALMWFFYRSAYSWSDSPDPSHTQTWEFILHCAETLQMTQLCRVASHALNRANALSDIRKVTLCAKHRLGSAWAKEEIKKVITRDDALSADEVHALGVDVAVLLNVSREKLLRGPRLHPQCGSAKCTSTSCAATVTCSKGVHLCTANYCSFRLSPRSCPKSPELDPTAVEAVASAIDLPKDSDENLATLRTFDKGYTHGGDVFIKVGDQLFYLHRYHLCAASPVFAGVFSLPTEDQSVEGMTMDTPIKLEGVKASDFESLLYFFYDSAYEWLPNVDPKSIHMWESILHLADKFVMDNVKAVALHALGRKGALGDAHKLALCVRYNIDKTWAKDAFKQICSRGQSLRDEELEILPPKMAGAVSRAREALLWKSAQRMTVPSADVVQQVVGDCLFRIHSFHLMRSMTPIDKFTEFMDLGGDSTSDDHPIALDDLDAKDFEGLMWFFYDSLYIWDDGVDVSDVSNWESALLCAEKFHMPQVAKVACYALDCAKVLSDIRKIVLCEKFGMGNVWAEAALTTVITRATTISYDEGQLLGLRISLKICDAREYLRGQPPPSCDLAKCGTCGRSATCCNSLHMCTHVVSAKKSSTYLHYTSCPKGRSEFSPSAVKAAVSTVALCESTCAVDAAFAEDPRWFMRLCMANGDAFFKVEGQLLAVHSYHLIAASPVFASMFSLPTSAEITKEGTSHHRPIHLEQVKLRDFQRLLYFFYDSAYERPPVLDSDTTAIWESVLYLSDMLDMEKVKGVALCALKSSEAITDAHKVALCLKYNVNMQWAKDAIQRLITRSQSLTDEDIEELITQPKMVGLISRTREALMRPVTASLFGIAPNYQNPSQERVQQEMQRFLEFRST